MNAQNKEQKVLILEDSEERIAIFKERIPPAVIVNWPEECIAELKRQRWDWLFLDHDLGGKVFQPSDEKSGYAVALWLEQNPEYKPKNVIIHSLNDVAAPRMHAAIKGSRWIPGVWTMLSFGSKNQ
jgi:CheY-like chemotaxis protein